MLKAIQEKLWNDFRVLMRKKALMRMYCYTCNPEMKSRCRRINRKQCEHIAQQQAELDVLIKGL